MTNVESMDYTHSHPSTIASLSNTAHLFAGIIHPPYTFLKTASVQVCSIQIMQVRVQNKGKSVWKSRYDGDVSHGTREASNGGRVRVRIIHGLNISHKELIYLLQKSISYQKEVLRACSKGDWLVGKYHRSSPTATHKEDKQ